MKCAFVLNDQIIEYRDYSVIPPNKKVNEKDTILPVIEADKPAYDSTTHKIEENISITDTAVNVSWNLTPLSEEEMINVRLINNQLTVKQFFSDIIQAKAGNTTFTPSTTSPSYNTGTEFFSQSIIPTTLTSKINILLPVFVDSSSSGRYITVALYRDQVNIACSWIYNVTAGRMQSLIINHTDVPNTTETVNYSARVSVSSGGWYINSSHSGRNLENKIQTHFTVSEL